MKTTRRGFIKGILGATATAVVAPTVFNTPKPEVSGRAINMGHGPTIGDDIANQFKRLEALREDDFDWYNSTQWSDKEIKVLKMRIHESHVSPKINTIRKVKL